ncbi:hypothetical protein G5B31_12100 [Rhodobacter sp. SGA-6-6]|uniref:hypothetical protein n=1 Tax=Rhodobacter sp. SGA-6-6 TaxID=2710882 RepID=UPI0013EC1744|nr:hypothetical protein [Rhodobacter sp. SGA-6-6]NGM46278.1 hypothetical protein [Rhodobacter sp. SGA-6-6]
MTTAEQALADDKMRAEIAKMFGEISKMAAETAKLNAETAKIARERFWIPFTIFAGVLVAVLTILPKLFGL